MTSQFGASADCAGAPSTIKAGTNLRFGPEKGEN